MRNYAKLDKFFDERLKDIGFTLVNTNHNDVAKNSIDTLIHNFNLTEGMKILDVGCGTGRDSLYWAEKGFYCDGVSTVMTRELLDFLPHPKVVVFMADQNFMSDIVSQNWYDVVFSRHVLEHSPIPYHTLCEYNSALKMGGLVYVEVPAPDQVVNHEVNHNHYSVFGRNMWESLFERSGFEIECRLNTVQFLNEQGELLDEWFRWVLRKVSEPKCGGVPE